MQKEMQQAGADGFRFAAVMGGDTAVGGKEVVVIMRRPGMEKELKQAGDAGYEVLGMTVGNTMIGGSEIVTITRRQVR